MMPGNGGLVPVLSPSFRPTSTSTKKYHVRLQLGDNRVLRVLVSDNQRVGELKAHLPDPVDSSRKGAVAAGPVVDGAAVTGDRDIEAGVPIPLVRRVRFIAKGRLLDENRPLGYYGFQEEDFIVCNVVHVESTPAQPAAAAAGTGAVSARRSLPPFGGLPGPPVPAAAATNGAASASGSRAPSPAPARGFERLLEMGYPPQEVAIFRAQLYASRNIDPSALPDRDTLQQMEEEWMSGEVRQDELAQNMSSAARERDHARIQLLRMREGTHKDMFLGIIMGFLLNIVMLLWIGDRHFSRQKRVGILTGIAVNFAFGMLHQTLNFSED